MVSIGVVAGLIYSRIDTASEERPTSRVVAIVDGAVPTGFDVECLEVEWLGRPF